MELHINEPETAATLEKFLSEKLNRSGLSGYIIGLSGGIDSSLSAAIAVRAVGPQKVLGLILPYSRSQRESESDARRFADKFQIRTQKIDITPMIDAYFGNIDAADPVRAGNKMARERMSILFDKASQYNCLVLGTSNRTEICLGYGTWYGDVACSVNPLGMLYKSQVRQLAKYYQIPDTIISKPPTADLWPGQTDEGELGLEYDKVDRLLFLLIEKQIRDRKALNAAGFDDRFIDRTLRLLNKSYFKRHLPEIADIGYQPIPDNITLN
ncbi:MAG: NAD+ synthase [bacterium]|jgi:NAD+ synthase